MNILKYFLYKYSFLFRFLRDIKTYDNMKRIKTVIVENGESHEFCFRDIDKIKNVKARFKGILNKTNQLIIELPQTKKLKIVIFFQGSDNVIKFGSNCSGKWGFGLYQYGNKCTVGHETTNSGVVHTTLVNNELIIGKNCMFSTEIRIIGDGHSVLSWPTKEVLNEPKNHILIGNHCWIGEKVILTKNAQVPNDCIVGIASVVTKKFDEEHCVLAGAPAKIVKHDITWHGLAPKEYKKQYN